jgi:Ser/Thr protein kinase RdoA (MazF antagonist)
MKQLNQVVLLAAVQFFDIQPKDLVNLNGSECFVYSYRLAGKDYILKVIHSSHRTTEDILAEVDWLQYLDASNINISVPVHSNNGNYVEKVNWRKSYYSVISYEKAKGRIIEKSEFTPLLIQNWGATMGKIHSVTKSYQPTVTKKRNHWHENKYLNIDSTTLPVVKRKYLEIKERLLSLPMTSNDYGLIHSDFHHRNFLVDGNTITVIDFDDAEYSWFINDIAKTLYNETFNFSILPKERDEFAAFFLDQFLTGYQNENMIDSYWMQFFQDFLELRHLFILIRRYHSMNRSNQQKLINQFESDIKNKEPLLNVNFKIR